MHYSGKLRPDSALAIEPGGYVRIAPNVVQYYPNAPQLPTLGVSLPRRWYCERVRHEAAYEADLILYDGNDERLLAMRQVAAWGDVICAYNFGDNTLYLKLYDDAATKPPNFDVLHNKWPHGPVIVH